MMQFGGTRKTKNNKQQQQTNNSNNNSKSDELIQVGAKLENQGCRLYSNGNRGAKIND